MGTSIKTINEGVFCGPSGGDRGFGLIFYKLDEDHWNNVQISNHNYFIVFFYSETEPTGDGRFWHYGANGRSVENW